MEDAGDVRPLESAGRARWLRLLDYARWAPSPHNIQPWRIRIVSDDEAELLYDPARLLPHTDPRGRFSAVGLGVFVECLAVAAAGEGAELVVRGGEAGPVPADGSPRPYATLQLRAAATREELDRELLLRRRTSRIEYDGRPVDAGILRELAAVPAEAGHRLAWSSDRELVRLVLDLNRETMFGDMDDSGTRDEIGRWLRFSSREAATTRDGFSPECLGFPGWLLRLFFRRHPIFELPGLRALVRGLHDRTTRGTRTVAWLAGPFDRPGEWLAAGRMLARLWLTSTRADVHLHPFGSIITSADAYARMQARTGPLGDGTLWLVMRLGSGPEPPRSLRLEKEQLVVG